MLTKLAKALGLQPPKVSHAEQDLLRLALKGKCAGDRYYYNMEQAVFDSAMEGDEEEDFYHFHVRQRSIGVEAFRQEVAEEIRTLSGDQLHTIVQHHNYDSGLWLLAQIVAHPACEFATALCIYWANQPCDYYARYGNFDRACEDVDALSHANGVLLKQIEHRTRLGTFAQALAVPDVSGFLDCRPDYSVKPLSDMPVALRVHC